MTWSLIYFPGQKNFQGELQPKRTGYLSQGPLIKMIVYTIGMFSNPLVNILTQISSFGVQKSWSLIRILKKIPIWSAIKFWLLLKTLGIFPSGRQISSGRLLILTPLSQLVDYFEVVLYSIVESTHT